MGRYCSVFGCLSSTNKSGRRFFKFPLDQVRCKQWIEACDRSDLSNKNIESLRNNFVCDLHFLDSEYKNMRILNKYAIPTQNLPQDSLDPSTVVIPDNLSPHIALDSSILVKTENSPPQDPLNQSVAVKIENLPPQAPLDQSVAVKTENLPPQAPLDQFAVAVKTENLPPHAPLDESLTFETENVPIPSHAPITFEIENLPPQVMLDPSIAIQTENLRPHIPTLEQKKFVTKIKSTAHMSTQTSVETTSEITQTAVLTFPKSSQTNRGLFGISKGSQTYLSWCPNSSKRKWISGIAKHKKPKRSPLVQNLIKLQGKERNSGNRYDEDLKQLAKTIYAASPIAYRAVAKTLCLPSERTLRRMKLISGPGQVQGEGEGGQDSVVGGNPLSSDKGM